MGLTSGRHVGIGTRSGLSSNGLGTPQDMTTLVRDAVAKSIAEVGDVAVPPGGSGGKADARIASAKQGAGIGSSSRMGAGGAVEAKALSEESNTGTGMAPDMSKVGEIEAKHGVLGETGKSIKAPRSSGDDAAAMLGGGSQHGLFGAGMERLEGKPVLGGERARNLKAPSGADAEGAEPAIPSKLYDNAKADLDAITAKMMQGESGWDGGAGLMAGAEKPPQDVPEEYVKVLRDKAREERKPVSDQEAMIEGLKKMADSPSVPPNKAEGYGKVPVEKLHGRKPVSEEDAFLEKLSKVNERLGAEVFGNDRSPIDEKQLRKELLEKNDSIYGGKKEREDAAKKAERADARARKQAIKEEYRQRAETGDHDDLNEWASELEKNMGKMLDSTSYDIPEPPEGSRSLEKKYESLSEKLYAINDDIQDAMIRMGDNVHRLRKEQDAMMQEKERLIEEYDMWGQDVQHNLNSYNEAIDAAQDKYDALTQGDYAQHEELSGEIESFQAHLKEQQAMTSDALAQLEDRLVNEKITEEQYATERAKIVAEHNAVLEASREQIIEQVKDAHRGAKQELERLLAEKKAYVEEQRAERDEYRKTASDMAAKLEKNLKEQGKALVDYQVAYDKLRARAIALEDKVGDYESDVEHKHYERRT